MEILEALKKLQNEGRKHDFETIFGKIYKENVCFILGRKRCLFEHLGGVLFHGRGRITPPRIEPPPRVLKNLSRLLAGSSRKI